MLNGLWKARGCSPEGDIIEFDASVPGCVHTDLIKNKKIENPLLSDNSLKCRWIERWTWIYERAFTMNSIPKKCFIEFEMLDVYCDIYLNGKKLGFCDDMFYPHMFDVSDILVEGENNIRVIFYSPVLLTENKPRLKGAFTRERMYTRRIQCTYGWDWVDRFVTAGICGNVAIVIPASCETDNIYVQTVSIDKYSAQVKLEIKFSGEFDGCFGVVEIFSPDKTLIFHRRVSIAEENVALTVDIENPKLWYPIGYGKPNLYKTAVTVETENGKTVSFKETSFGIRKIKVLQSEDEKGSSNHKKCMELKKISYLSGKCEKNDMNTHYFGFIVIVNDIPVMCKGANWVPCEPFVSEETEEKISALLKLSYDAGMNLIRVWGGGIFEREHFYNECDRLGIMVCQDFLMACGSYPENDAKFCENMKKEAEYITVRLRNHPSLIWWSGDNENAADSSDNMTKYPGRYIVRKIIEPIVRKNDSGRYFFPSSPFGGIPYGSVTAGTTHNTKFLIPKFKYFMETDMKDYQQRFSEGLSRFGVEEPILGAPSLCTVEKFITGKKLDNNSEEIWRFHTKNNGDAFKTFEIYDCMIEGARKLFGKFTGVSDKLLKMQYLQYEWVRITMESYRRNKWFSSGILYWMLNDCWPAFGWALIDYNCIPKAGWYAFKRSAKGVIASISEKDNYLQIHICNDSAEPKKGQLKIYRVNDDVKKVSELDFTQKANTSEIVYKLGITEDDKNDVWICDVKSESINDRAVWFSARPQDIKFKKPKISILRQTDDSITLAAKTYVHAVRLEAEAVFDDNYFTMLPGEERTIHFKTQADECTVKVDALYV